MEERAVQRAERRRILAEKKKKQEEEKQERIRESQLLRDGGSSLDLFLEMFVGIPGFKRYTEAY